MRIRLAVVSSVIWLFVVGASADSDKAQLTTARQIASSFLQELKAELMPAMREAGPRQAVSVCREKAPELARRQSAESGWDVGRTSLKVRNPANAPDAWERTVLERFEERRARGEDPAGMEYAETVEMDGKRYFRYLKAIPTAGVCLVCHGAELEVGLATRIGDLYPGDRATGFAVGEIRGAVTLMTAVVDP